jgi:hypothetical protein
LISVGFSCKSFDNPKPTTIFLIDFTPHHDRRVIPGNRILPVLHPASDEVVGTIDVGAIARMPSARATRTSSKIAPM